MKRLLLLIVLAAAAVACSPSGSSSAPGVSAPDGREPVRPGRVAVGFGGAVAVLMPFGSRSRDDMPLQRALLTG